jgi:hypothetical protein
MASKLLQILDLQINGNCMKSFHFGLFDFCGFHFIRAHPFSHLPQIWSAHLSPNIWQQSVGTCGTLISNLQA